jgi:hypothetical protein
MYYIREHPLRLYSEFDDQDEGGLKSKFQRILSFF